MKTSVSIIIPAYNCAAYLPRCLDSLLAQTLPAMQIIIIDDGSVDGSGKIADKYAGQNNNLFVYHQANGGVSAARNAGLKHAMGEYIGFVDSDDYVEPEMFEKMYTAAKRENADIAECGFFIENGTCSYKKSMTNTFAIYNMPDSGLDGYLLDHILEFPVLWNRIYRHEIIETQKLLFAMEAGEDFLFNAQFAPFVVKAVVLPDFPYHYIQRGNSIMHSKQGVKKGSASPTMVEMFCQEIAGTPIYRQAGSEITEFYLFARAFTGFLFSTAAIGQSIPYFKNQLSMIIRWDRWEEFARVLCYSRQLEPLFEKNILSKRFYLVMQKVFSYLLHGRTQRASILMYGASKLIFIKKRTGFRRLFHENVQ